MAPTRAINESTIGAAGAAVVAAGVIAGEDFGIIGARFINESPNEV